jgi:hypothetical protein
MNEWIRTDQEAVRFVGLAGWNGLSGMVGTHAGAGIRVMEHSALTSRFPLGFVTTPGPKALDALQGDAPMASDTCARTP